MQHPTLQNKVQAHLSADMVQRILDENQQLILAVIENQQTNNTHECAQYLQNLQRNLMMLATIGDGQVNGAGGLCSVRARVPPASQCTPADSCAAGRGVPALVPLAPLVQFARFPCGQPRAARPGCVHGRWAQSLKSVPICVCRCVARASFHLWCRAPAA
jgi:hypothetical protein